MGAAVALRLAATFRFVKYLHRIESRQNWHRHLADATQGNILNEVVAIKMINRRDAREYLRASFHILRKIQKIQN
jgi:hypothetical protein